MVEVTDRETVLFEGVVVDPTPTTDYMDITVRDFKGLLLKKNIHGDKNYTGSTLSGIISALLTELNTRSTSDTYPENWSSEIDVEVTGIDIEFTDGDTYHDALQKLAAQIGKYWKVEKGVIKMKDIIGEDKTTGEKYTQLLYDYKTPDENNIANYKVKRYSTITNSLRVEGVNTENTVSIGIFGRLEEFSTIDVSEKTAYLERASKEQKEYILEINFKKVDTQIQLGDKLAILIDTAIDKVDFSGSLLVTRRKVKYLGTDIVYQSINISEVLIHRNEFTDNLNRYFTDVKNLKLS